MTDEQTLEYGFDRKGPGTRCGTGFVCECYWASSLHGDKCPEHGAMGTPITKEKIMSEQQTPACTGWYLCKVLDSNDEIEFPGWWDGTKWIMREGSPMTLPHVLRFRGPMVVLEPSQTIREIIDKWSREYRRRGNLPASQAIESAVLEAVGRMSKQPEPNQTARERGKEEERQRCLEILAEYGEGFSKHSPSRETINDCIARIRTDSPAQPAATIERKCENCGIVFLLQQNETDPHPMYCPGCEDWFQEKREETAQPALSDDQQRLAKRVMQAIDDYELGRKAGKEEGRREERERILNCI